ncbi:serine proteinase inhibitor IA-1 [Lobosporangium transversale]|uniref:Serine proteinase inhibitor IA-1 n=1 Tax=Lobosporangium transversale TaxID=64571 RepID=A0A1Y2GXD4_9FUNG|nr:serine proteinase inhibitor IA-1 [Lobosporangium transversale]ORZ26950.1 serine proteinase inhibitor IA-1 [Lobosporangium transversale]|eukprot:XP_021884697.1 serine proteinase inhibitor IA-1 [Lobosporangium transversale]
MSSNSRKVIIVFKDGTPRDEVNKAAEEIKSKGGKITQKYTLLLGFAAEVPEFELQMLNSHPHIDYIEDDGIVTIQK